MEIKQPAKRIVINWRTSSGGIASILLGASNIIRDINSGEPLNVEHLTANIGLILTGLSLMFARDSAVTSEQCGVTPSKASINDAEKVGTK